MEDLFENLCTTRIFETSGFAPNIIVQVPTTFIDQNLIYFPVWLFAAGLKFIIKYFFV